MKKNHEPDKSFEGKDFQKTEKRFYNRYTKVLRDIHDRLVDEIQLNAQDHFKTPKDSSSDLSSHQFHPADAGTDNFDRDFVVTLISNAQETLYEINAALERLEAGTFGICEMCGKPISLERLDAIPWARFGEDCQTLFEKDHPKQPVFERIFKEDKKPVATEEEIGKEVSSNGFKKPKNKLD